MGEVGGEVEDFVLGVVVEESAVELSDALGAEDGVVEACHGVEEWAEDAVGLFGVLGEGGEGVGDGCAGSVADVSEESDAFGEAAEDDAIEEACDGCGVVVVLAEGFGDFGEEEGGGFGDVSGVACGVEGVGVGEYLSEDAEVGVGFSRRVWRLNWIRRWSVLVKLVRIWKRFMSETTRRGGLPSAARYSSSWT